MFHTIFFDLDNTIYPADCGLWQAIGKRIDSYLSEEMHLQMEDITAFRVYCRENFGTTLQGLKSVYDIDEQQYLRYVHNVDLSLYLKKDLELVELIRSLPQRKVILTNADENHSRNVLRYLEIEPCFDLIIDVNKLNPHVKPEPESFQIALDLAGTPSADGCVFLDDYLPNVLAAQGAGFFSILVDQKQKSDFPCRIPDLYGLPKVLNKSPNQG